MSLGCLLVFFFFPLFPTLRQRALKELCSFCSLQFVKPSVRIFSSFPGIDRHQSEQIAETVAIYNIVIATRNWTS